MEKQASLTREAKQRGRPVEPPPEPPLDNASMVLALIERVTLDPRADVEKLERLTAMYERLKAKEAELAFNGAKGRILKKLAGIDTTGGKSNVQAVGSTNSFLRRYVACNIFNIVVVGDDDDGNGGTIDEAQAKTIVELIKKAKVGPKFLKYMRAQSVEEAGSVEAAVATIAARDYRKAVSTLEEQIAKAGAGHAHLS